MLEEQPITAKLILKKTKRAVLGKITIAARKEYHGLKSVATHMSNTEKIGKNLKAFQRYSNIKNGKYPFQGTPEEKKEKLKMESTTMNIIDSLYDGDLEAMQSHFDTVMGDKMGEALVDRKIAVASTLFKDIQKEE